MELVTRKRLGISFVIIGLSLSGAAMAEAPVDPCCASGDHRGNFVATSALGKTSPDAVNYSRVPGWQVFLFNRGGLDYVEVADANGVPRAAFTALGDSIITLPVGGDTVQQVAFAPAAAAVVYENSTLAVAAITDSAGATVWQVYVK